MSDNLGHARYMYCVGDKVKPIKGVKPLYGISDSKSRKPEYFITATCLGEEGFEITINFKWSFCRKTLKKVRKIANFNSDVLNQLKREAFDSCASDSDSDFD